jgi:predicted transcriptional regulator
MGGPTPEKHLSLLLENKLLTLDTSNKYYVTTSKGLLFLKTYEEIKKMQYSIDVKKKILESLLEKEEIISDSLISVEVSESKINEFISGAIENLE